VLRALPELVELGPDERIELGCEVAGELAYVDEALHVRQILDAMRRLVKNECARFGGERWRHSRACSSRCRNAAILLNSTWVSLILISPAYPVPQRLPVPGRLGKSGFWEGFIFAGL